MKKIIAFLLSLIVVFSGITVFGAEAAVNTVVLTIGSSAMLVNGESKAIDEQGTAPVIIDGRTLLPVRAVVEEFGGTVGWEAETQTVTLVKGEDTVKLVIGEKTAYLNDEASELDTAPAIINGRTMLPIRFVAESFGLVVNWEAASRTVTIAENVQAVEPEQEPEEITDGETGKTLIVYFSQTGSTKKLAGYIEDRVDADVFEIVPETAYPTDDAELKAIAQEEKDSNARPAYKGSVKSLSSYDIVYVGYPIWYDTMPMIVKAFLENTNLSGKTVVPFSTNGGSGWGSSLDDIKALCPNSEIANGYSIEGSKVENAKNDLELWIEELYTE